MSPHRPARPAEGACRGSSAWEAASRTCPCPGGVCGWGRSAGVPLRALVPGSPSAAPLPPGRRLVRSQRIGYSSVIQGTGSLEFEGMRRART